MRETKIIQVYPSDSAIQKAISEWESFGWEMTDNQRLQDKENLWYPGGTTVRTTTYNKLTFSREKASPWYDEVVELEKQYNSCMDLEPVDYSVKPSKCWLVPGIIFAALGIIYWLMMVRNFFELYAMVPALAMICVGAVLLTVYIVKNKKCKKVHRSYEDKLQAWEKTSKIEADKLRKKAEAIINAS